MQLASQQLRLWVFYPMCRAGQPIRPPVVPTPQGTYADLGSQGICDIPDTRNCRQRVRTHRCYSTRLASARSPSEIIKESRSARHACRDRGRRAPRAPLGPVELLAPFSNRRTGRRRRPEERSVGGSERASEASERATDGAKRRGAESPAECDSSRVRA